MVIVCLERVIPTLIAYACDHSLSITSLYNIVSFSNQSNWLFYCKCDVAGYVLFLFLVVPCVHLQFMIVGFPGHLLERRLLSVELFPIQFKISFFFHFRAMKTFLVE